MERRGLDAHEARAAKVRGEAYHYSAISRTRGDIIAYTEQVP